MNLTFKFALRYLFSKKSANAINIISYISMLGMTICTAAFILILSVFNGFEGLVKDLYNSFYPDMKIVAAEGKTFELDSLQWHQIQSIDGVRAASKVLEESALLVYGNRQQPARVKGVDENYVHVTGLDTCMAFADSFQLVNNGQYFAVIGSGIDQSLEVKLRDPLEKMTVFMPKRGKSRSIVPGGDFRRSEIMIWGIFVIQDEFDNQYIFTPIGFVRNLLRYENEISAIEMGIQPGVNIDDVKAKIEKVLGRDYKVMTKYEQNAFLYKIMNIERFAVYVILSFVLLIVGFNIIGSLSMVIIEKKRDIGILKTMGANQTMIRRIFLYEGILQGVFSLLIGFAIAIILVVLQQKSGLVPISGSGSFVVAYYPVELKWIDFFIVAMIVLAISGLSSWFPANKASKQSGIEVLQK
jgi:lipoprotein-releasing system permease protein